MYHNRGFSSLTILGIIGLLVIFMIAGIAVMSLKKSTPTAATTQSTTDTQGKFVEHTLDLSAGVADSQKTVVIIEQSDSSMEKVILPSSSVAAYIKGLPQGAKFISQTPFSNASQ